MDWRASTACLGYDTEWFFPVGSSGPALEQIEQAKAVCGRCAVSTYCLDRALATGQTDGIWGGLTEGERRELRRRQLGGRWLVNETTSGGPPLSPRPQ